MAAANGNGGTRAQGPRCIALVGPFQSGKTTLLEAILARTGAIQRQGTVDAGTTVGDASKEARHHRMSVELSVATTNFMGDSYTFIDCPGSVEFIHDMRAALPGGRRRGGRLRGGRKEDSAAAADPARARRPEDSALPVPQQDRQGRHQAIRDVLQLLQPASRMPLLLRQIPIWNGDIVTGFVDLALERAYVYKEHAASEVVPLDGEDLDREKTARFSMLETLADHDDELMEQLLEDIPPPRDKVFDDLAKELRDGLVCPVLMGVATRTNGVLRLLKALRHEAPGVEATAKRLGVKAGNDAVAYVLKTFHTAPWRQDVGRARARRPGRRRHRRSLSPEREAGRVSGVFKLMGQTTEKRGAGRRRRDRRARQARTCQDRRHAVGRQAGACAAGARSKPHRAGAGDRGVRQGAQGRRQARPGAAQAARGGPVAHRRAQRRKPTKWSSGGRARCTCASRPSGWPTASASPIDDRPPERRLRETIKKGAVAARPAQEAVRRPRPVRRRGARHQADAARLGLQVRGEDHRRRGAAQLHSVGRGGRRSTRSSTARSASRWSTWR